MYVCLSVLVCVLEEGDVHRSYGFSSSFSFLIVSLVKAAQNKKGGVVSAKELCKGKTKAKLPCKGVRVKQMAVRLKQGQDGTVCERWCPP